MALTGGGGQSGGPQYGWGGVPNDLVAGSGTNFNSGLNSGRYTSSPEAGLRRGAWQWQGHGPSAQRDYGWDYQGGVGRDEIAMRTEARDGGSYLSHMAQDRSGGLPRYNSDYDIGDRSLRGAGGGVGHGQDYDRGFRGHEIGNGRGQYDQGFRAAGGATFGSGNRSRGGFRGDLAPAFGGQYGVGNKFADRYDRELRARDSRGFGGQYEDGYRAMGGGPGVGSGHRTGYSADFGGGNREQMNRGSYEEITYGFGPRQSSGGYGARQGGGYGAGGGGGQRSGYAREFGQGRALGGRGGGYGAGYRTRPLTDDEFYSRVNRW